MKRIDPYLRQIFVSDFLPNKDFVKAYDCRFFFVLSGEGELITENGRFGLFENTLAYYPSGLSYLLKSSESKPLSFVTVNFDFTRSYPLCTATLRPVRVCDFSSELERPTQKEISEERFRAEFTVEHAFSLREDFLSLCSLFREQDAVYKEELCSALLKCVILKLSNSFHAKSKDNEIVRQVSRYVDENYAEALDNHALAARFGYHPYYLSSLFKAHTGITLHQYTLRTRLRHGASMLLNTDMPISRIASKCGFKDSNHFSVKFKKEYGESPSNWRRINSVI